MPLESLVWVLLTGPRIGKGKSYEYAGPGKAISARKR